MNIMIKTDIVNPGSLAETVRNDIYTSVWMKYICLSRNIRRPLSAGSPAAKEIYLRFDRYTILSLLTFCTVVLCTFTLYFHYSFGVLVIEAIPIFAFTWFELRKKKLLIALAGEMLTTLWPDQPPKGTFFQFGEEVARQYNLTSFIDFNGKLDKLLKTGFCVIFTVAVISYTHTSWLTFTLIMLLNLCWPLFLQPVKILSFVLRLK